MKAMLKERLGMKMKAMIKMNIVLEVIFLVQILMSFCQVYSKCNNNISHVLNYPLKFLYIEMEHLPFDIQKVFIKKIINHSIFFTHLCNINKIKHGYKILYINFTCARRNKKRSSLKYRPPIIFILNTVLK
ncbi:hypothetical protein C922_05644 [Plasmodium inui San Antonio 1]|uniref:Uncharacterized protein n=1 Tax=Plasmodium inui San Antonio 1 TaxID=1237626 RepID=W7A4D7_9APIC|nr:hypothetical protein C922_05644 [Plasmodium inui San Antonio 1]EUD63974.1 hypothetical protein C922_05644 [Plasmodium inui San Antonio 1]